MEKINISFESPNVFFNERLSLQEKEELEKLNHATVKKKFCTIKNFKNPQPYRKDAVFSIVKFEKELDRSEIEEMMQDKSLEHGLVYDLMSNSSEKDRFVHVGTKSYQKLSNTFKNISKENYRLGEKLLERFHLYVANETKEADLANDNLKVTQNAIVKYLKENNIEKKVFAINFDKNNEKSIDAWFNELRKQEQPCLPAYNDLDYTPFLINGVYIVEDISSDYMYIYKELNETSGSWYAVSRSNFGEMDDVKHTAFYESNTYLEKAIKEYCDQFSLVAKIENNKIIKATAEITNLELIQNFIYDELEESGLVKRDVKDLTLEDLIASYRVLNDLWGNQSAELKFLEMLNDDSIKEVNGKISFQNYVYITPENYLPLKDKTNDEKIKELNYRLGNNDYYKLKKIKSENKEIIKNYLDKNIIPLTSICSPEVQDCVNQIIKSLNLPVKKIKP